jgi:uncharacterized protein (UPF0332 family)
MTGRDFMACAEKFSQGSTEAELRSAVSRAYYGAFHDVLALLHVCGVWLPKTEQVHVKMGFCLRDCGDPDAANTGRQLDILRSRRKVADYDLNDNRFAARSAVAVEIERARRILATIDQIDSSSGTGFRTKIRNHAKLLGLNVSE